MVSNGAHVSLGFGKKGGRALENSDPSCQTKRKKNNKKNLRLEMLILSHKSKSQSTERTTEPWGFFHVVVILLFPTYVYV